MMVHQPLNQNLSQNSASARDQARGCLARRSKQATPQRVGDAGRRGQTDSGADRSQRNSGIGSADCLRFGRRIRALREAQGHSQESLAAKIQSHRNYIGRLERGEQNPTLTVIKRLAKALKVSAGELVED